MWLPSDNYFTNYTDTELGGTRYKFKTANVLAKARSHFGCSSLDGLELENQVPRHWCSTVCGVIGSPHLMFFHFCTTVPHWLSLSLTGSVSVVSLFVTP